MNPGIVTLLNAGNSQGLRARRTRREGGWAPVGAVVRKMQRAKTSAVDPRPA